MSIEWDRLRSFDGSVQHAFEELCAQLVSNEKFPSDSTFVRNGLPDGGVEFYWTLPDGKEYGWQVKYFTNLNDSHRFSQIDRSVKDSIRNHPNLISYTVCLAMDLPDAKVKNKKSAKEKWDGYVIKWNKIAQENGKSIEFRYWGDHQIWKRLSAEENRGRHYFWFNKDFFSNEWYKKSIEVSRANVGPRYSSEYNVDLPIIKYFNGLGRTNDFFKEFTPLFNNIQRAYNYLDLKKIEEIIGTSEPVIDQDIEELERIHGKILKHQLGFIDFNSINVLCSTIQVILTDWNNNIKQKIRDEKRDWIEQNRDKDKLYSHLQNYEDPYSKLLQLNQELSNLKEFALGNAGRSANIPLLLITGNAGNGKTHLLCDVAVRRIGTDLPTILLLGSHFRDDEPWNQIIKHLGLNCNRDEFLGALNTTAEIAKSKCLIFIDALNEGDGKKLWRKYLAGMIETLKNYPRLGIVLSVRSSYKNIIIPEGFDSNNYVEIIHEGFSGHEFEASKIFFDHYNIERPTIPILNPEFKNPLFLKTFCEAIQNHGETKIPEGIQGISKVFNYYIDSIDEKLSREEYLDFDPKSKIVQKAMEEIASHMAENGNPWLLYEDAKNIVDNILGNKKHSQSLFRHLVSEGILSEDVIWDKDDNYNEVIRFSYERFSDYLITESLFKLHFESGEICDLFKNGKPLFQLIKDEPTCWQNQGLIEALSIQIPERYGQELSDVAPHCANFQSVREAFINSIIWRHPTAFSKSTLTYINNYILKTRKPHDQNLVFNLLDAFLQISSNPNHPYNADQLHKWLFNLKLGVRDSLWTVYLSRRYNDETSIDSLIEWAWFSDVKETIDDESRRLYGITLAWFLTSSHRYLRDRTTKALISLFSNHLDLFHKILEDFIEVDDPYVLERLFAVAYGCAMRGNDTENIAILAKDVFTWIFEDGCPPPNILLRDYARGLIECSLQKNGDMNINVEKIQPPYTSACEDFIPDINELKKDEIRIKKLCENSKAATEIYDSVMGFEDFARYVIGTNSDSFDWSSRRLKNSRPTVMERYLNFVGSLNKDKKNAWDKFEYHFNATKNPIISENNGDFSIIIEKKFSARTIKKYENLLLSSLNSKEKKIFDKYVIPYLENPHKYRKDDKKFNITIAQQWILKRVFDLGWTEERFGDFDNWMIILNNRNYIRAANKPERIGKKYQWIAYYEFLAIVSDNFKLKNDYWGGQSSLKYDGPWQLNVRNIDPSILSIKTEPPGWESDGSENNWWFTEQYNQKEPNETDEQWISGSNDLPNVKALIQVTNPKDCSEWLNLNGIYNWSQHTDSDEIMHKTKRELFYIIHVYIVKKQDSQKAFRWAQKVNFKGRWMPDPFDFHTIYLGEFVWSPAYIGTTANGYSEWKLGLHYANNNIPCPIHNPCVKYNWSSGGYDCSIEEGISISIPSAWLIEKMGLSWNGEEGKWFNNKGELVAFDPSVNERGPQCLLINKKYFTSFLNENGYDIFWALLGEKNIISGMPPSSCLYITGAYQLKDNEVIGKKKSTYTVFDDGIEKT